MEAFQPDLACRSFAPRFPPRASRRSGGPRFVSQEGRRFVIRCYGEREEEGAEAAAREVDAIAAFEALGVGALAPAFGPVDRLEVRIDGELHQLLVAVAFPYVDEPTLFHALATVPDPPGLLEEAGRRIADRHRSATRLQEIHSDGSCHNVFCSWTWFDFGARHAERDLSRAKAHEVWRFLTSVVETTALREDAARVGSFCEGYGDREVLALALDLREHRPWTTTLLSHPMKLVRLTLGETRHLRRPRTARALASWLGGRASGPKGRDTRIRNDEAPPR